MHWLTCPVGSSPVLMVRSEFSSEKKERAGARRMNTREREEGRGERHESRRSRRKGGRARKKETAV